MEIMTNIFQIINKSVRRNTIPMMTAAPDGNKDSTSLRKNTQPRLIDHSLKKNKKKGNKKSNKCSKLMEIILASSII
jgi:hypothetical protein